MILGIFNCQGAGSWPSVVSEDNIPVKTSAPSFISSNISPQAVKILEELARENWNGDCAVYVLFRLILHSFFSNILHLTCNFSFFYRITL